MINEEKKQHATFLMLVVEKLGNYKCSFPSPTSSYFPKQKKTQLSHFELESDSKCAAARA